MLKQVFTVTALFVLLSVAAFADGGFYGEVKYIDCDVTLGDKVMIKPLAGDPIPYFIEHLHHPSTYDTRFDTFPPGTYKLWVELTQNSGCEKGYVEIVIHGSERQRVDLTVIGDTGTPTGGGGN